MASFLANKLFRFFIFALLFSFIRCFVLFLQNQGFSLSFLFQSFLLFFSKSFLKFLKSSFFFQLSLFLNLLQNFSFFGGFLGFLLFFLLTNFQILSLSFFSPFIFVLLDLSQGLRFFLFQSLLFHLLHKLFLVDFFRLLSNLIFLWFFRFFNTFIFSSFQFISNSANSVFLNGFSLFTRFFFLWFRSCFFHFFKRWIMTNFKFAWGGDQCFLYLTCFEEGIGGGRTRTKEISVLRVLW